MKYLTITNMIVAGNLFSLYFKDKILISWWWLLPILLIELIFLYAISEVSKGLDKVKNE